MLSHALLSPPAVDNERQPKAPSEENNPGVIETKVTDFLSHVERNSPQRRYESPDEGPRVASSGSAATSENARFDDGSKSKEDGGQSGTTASHDVDGKTPVGATANPKAEENTGRRIGSCAESRALDGKPLVGTTANAGAKENAGRDTVENPGGGREGGAVGGEVHKKPSAVTVVSPHAEAGGVKQTRRESDAGATPSPTIYTQKTTMTGRNRSRKSVDQRSVYSLSTLKDLASISICGCCQCRLALMSEREKNKESGMLLKGH
ncbi:uncharacterized protein LOC125943539 [Dermacentor silvarum]|uniref:uncharacterized protein LOC125943539 n=1 Tax=Dermacentor silvarum TaxID=543639 RepID=UPI002100EB37|nr:uncharacterized protein LOC125943539 [Dermacentor silvarum]